jgi:DNA replication protein DnaC
MKQRRFELPARYSLKQYPADLVTWVDWYIELFSKAFNTEFIDAQPDLLRALLLYFSGNENNIFPLNKGVMLWGKTGMGKSLMLEALRIFTLNCFNANWYRRYTVNSVALIKDENWFTEYLNFTGNAFYDDLGCEPLSVKVWGSELYPMLEVITARYNLWQLSGQLTHFTSNRDMEWIKERYGIRIAARLAEMCTVIEVKGKNLRIN